jgi:uncharacterized integral membrane protein
VLRKTVAACVLVPLAILIIAFAVANRHVVTVSLDPFGASSPSAAITLPLFALIIAVLIIGVLIGGAAAWLEQGAWRRTARRLQREASDLRREIASLKPAAAPADIAGETKPPERLRLRPPAR